MLPTRRITTSGGDVFRDEFSLAFDGTDDYIATGGKPVDTADATYVFWTKSSFIGSHNRAIFGHGGDRVGEFSLQYNSDGKALLYLENNLYQYWDDGAGNSHVSDGKWHHVAVVVDIDSMPDCKLYIDGVEIPQSSRATTATATAYGNMEIGRANSTTEFEGSLSEFAVYDKMLSISEVKTLYNGREPYNHKEGVCSSNLQAWYRMGDGVLDTPPSNHTNSLLISDNTNATKGSNLWTETYSSNTGSWSADGTNNLTQENNAIKITGDGSDSDGARIKLRSSDDMSSNLTVGKLYELAFQSKVSSGSTVNVQFQISNAHSFVNFVNYTTEYKQFRHYFIATDATEAEIKCSSMGDGETIFMKDFSVREISGNAGVGNNFDGTDIVGDTP